MSLLSYCENSQHVLSCTWIVILNVTVPSSLSLSKRSHTTSHVNTVYVPISLFHHMWISYLGKAANWPHKLYLTDTSVDTHSHIHTYTLSLPSVYLCTLSLPLPMYSFSSSTYVPFLFLYLCTLSLPSTYVHSLFHSITYSTVSLTLTHILSLSLSLSFLL